MGFIDFIEYLSLFRRDALPISCFEPDGTVWLPDRFTAAFRRLQAMANIGVVRLHDLRHTHATQLLRQGIHPKIVSERLGHSSVGITLDTYSHVLPGMQGEAARKLDTALRLAINRQS
jgi:integrase